MYEHNVSADLNWIEAGNTSETIYDLKGEKYQEIFYKMKSVISNQFQNDIHKGIKGFVLFGPAGTGKTTLVKVIAKSLHKPLLFIDGKDVAGELYGQSEKNIDNIFKQAKKKKCIILIDDAESVFPDREWSKGQSWHSSQNNQLLHALDNLDTSQNVVIMTTNKPQLLDVALKDRLYEIEVGAPSIEVLTEIAKAKCEELNINDTEVIEEIKDCQSVRAVEKIVIEHYIRTLENGNGSS